MTPLHLLLATSILSLVSLQCEVSVKNVGVVSYSPSSSSSSSPQGPKADTQNDFTWHIEYANDWVHEKVRWTD